MSDTEHKTEETSAMPSAASFMNDASAVSFMNDAEAAQHALIAELETRIAKLERSVFGRIKDWFERHTGQPME